MEIDPKETHYKVESLKSIGKITIVVGVKGQNVNNIRPLVNNTIIKVKVS